MTLIFRDHVSLDLEEYHVCHPVGSGPCGVLTMPWPNPMGGVLNSTLAPLFMSSHPVVPGIMGEIQGETGK